MRIAIACAKSVSKDYLRVIIRGWPREIYNTSIFVHFFKSASEMRALHSSEPLSQHRLMDVKAASRLALKLLPDALFELANLIREYFLLCWFEDVEHR